MTPTATFDAGAPDPSAGAGGGRLGLGVRRAPDELAPARAPLREALLRTGEPYGISEMNPATSRGTIPPTRWWMCRSPVVTLPGHHGTLGERISRALVRMNRNAPRNATKASSAGRDDVAQGSASPRLMLNSIAASTGGFFQSPRPGVQAAVSQAGNSRAV